LEKFQIRREGSDVVESSDEEPGDTSPGTRDV